MSIFTGPGQRVDNTDSRICGRQNQVTAENIRWYPNVGFKGSPSGNPVNKTNQTRADSSPDLSSVNYQGQIPQGLSLRRVDSKFVLSGTVGTNVTPGIYYAKYGIVVWPNVTWRFIAMWSYYRIVVYPGA